MGEFGAQSRERADFGFQFGAFAAEFLRALGIVPEFGLFEFALDFGQALLLGIEVKDTPVRPGNGPEGRGVC